MFNWYNVISEYYKFHLYDNSDLDFYVKAKKITQEQADIIKSGL